jgi:hypothetical protein
MKRAAIAVLVLWTPLVVFGLTPKERAKVQEALTAVELAIGHGEELQKAAEQARIEADNANKVAGMAASSAFSAGVTARKAVTDAESCKKTVAEWEPIIKAVTGPWWFPGGRALIYGAKKSAISLVVIIGIGLLLAVIIKVVITAATGGTVTGGFRIVGGIFARVGKGVFGFFGRLGKRGLALAKKKGKAATTRQIDKIKHRTIGSDD